MANNTVTVFNALTSSRELQASFAHEDTSYYLFIGRANAWGSPDEPPAISNTAASLRNVYQNMIAAKRITGEMVRFVVPKITWANNTIYTQYEDNSVAYFANTANRRYALNSANDLFMCIDNANNVSSTVEPSDTSTVFTQTTDGYVWKFMQSVSIDDNLFLTDDWMPVLSNSQSTTLITEGTLDRIDIINGGTDFNDGASANNLAIISIVGDGTGATAVANVTAGVITNVRMMTRGQNYTYADITANNGLSAAFHAVLSPTQGHGAFVRKDLNAKNIFVAARIGRIDATEGGAFPVQTGFQFRQFGIVKEPYKYLSNDVLLQDTIQFGFSLVLSSGQGSTFVCEDEVFQLDESGHQIFSGVVIQASDTAAKIANVKGIPIAQSQIFGESANYRNVVSYLPPEVAKGTGDIIYVENVAPIARANNQSEVFRIAFSF